MRKIDGSRQRQAKKRSTDQTRSQIIGKRELEDTHELQATNNDSGNTTAFAARIIAWQRVRGRHDLPWQNTRDPYRIWLSEIMLQQTQVTAVIPYYQRFLGRFPDLASLAADANAQEFRCAWSRS